MKEKMEQTDIQPMSELMKQVFDRCDICGMRPKRPGKKWCQRCIDKYNRRNSLSGQRRLLLNIPPVYIEADVGDFDLNLEEWNMQDNLFFYGDTGTGKTRAMYALYKKSVLHGFDAELIEFLALCSEIRSSFDTKGGTTENEIIKKLSALDVLFIDDLGLQSNAVSDFSYQVFYRIIDKRIIDCLPLVISSNKTKEQIGKLYDKRIASRLHLFRTIKFDGEDKREANK